jgi:hypothetical protein
MGGINITAITLSSRLRESELELIAAYYILRIELTVIGSYCMVYRIMVDPYNGHSNRHRYGIRLKGKALDLNCARTSLVPIRTNAQDTDDTSNIEEKISPFISVSILFLFSTESGYILDHYGINKFLNCRRFRSL